MLIDAVLAAVAHERDACIAAIQAEAAHLLARARAKDEGGFRLEAVTFYHAASALDGVVSVLLEKRRTA